MLSQGEFGRIMGELLMPAPAGQRQVFDLTRSAGDFETSNEGLTPGSRTFGFWSFLTPKSGDLVVIQRLRTKVAYVITAIDDAKTFTGSDGNHFWVGTMDDIIHNHLVTRDIVDALRAAGLA